MPESNVNMVAMMETQNFHPELQKSKTNKQKYSIQMNRVQSMAKLKDSFLAIAYGYNIKLPIEKMLKVAIKCYDIIRPDRHFKRNKCYKYKREPLMYKAFSLA